MPSNVARVGLVVQIVPYSQKIGRREASLPYVFEYALSDARDGERPRRTNSSELESYYRPSGTEKSLSTLTKLEVGKQGKENKKGQGNTSADRWCILRTCCF